MSILAIDGLRKSYGVKPLLEDVTFVLASDEKMGLIGANGSGKTTLMRIIAGAEIPDGGRIMIPKRSRIAYLPQIPTFDPDHSVLDAVFDQGDPALRLLHDYEQASHALASGRSDDRLLARMSELSHRLDVTGGWDREAGARAILDRLGLVEPSARVGLLSGGEQKRVALARALLLQPDLLLLDEPTNHLDTETIAWLEAYLADYQGALLLVTHDRYFLDRVTNRMLEVHPGGVTKYDGNYSRYLELKERQEAVAEATERTRRNLARRELEWLRRGPKARTSKAKYRVERARALQEEVSTEPDQALELTAASTRLGKKVIEIERVSKSYGGQVLIDEYSRLLTRQDRIGIIGPNGSGKTTLLDMIAGRVQPDSGSIEIGPTVAIGYVDQKGRPLDDSKRVIETVTDVAEYVRTADGTLISAGQMLERFLFPPSVQYTPVGNLSGGERRRLHLLLVLMSAPNVLLLDEPTNDLDIPTLAALEEYLDTFPGALIVVSHDRWFLDRTIEEVLRLDGDGGIRSYPGDYSAYLEIRDRERAHSERTAAEAAGNAAVERVAAEAAGNAAVERVTSEKAAANGLRTSPEAASSSASSNRKLSYRETKELEQLELRIGQAESRKVEIETEIQLRPDHFETVAALSSEMGEINDQLEKDMERWAELAERA